MYEMLTDGKGKEQAMRRSTVTLPENNQGSLSQPPHALNQVIDMLVGNQPLPLEQQKERWDHLAHCLECQVFLGIYLVNLIEYDRAAGNPTEPAQELLTKLTAILNDLHETLKEDIPAYVEALEELNVADANQKFPQLCEHVLFCQDCQEAVEDLRFWLRHLKEAELEQGQESIAR